MYEQVGKADVWPWRAKHYMADEVKAGLRDPDLRRSFARNIREAAAAEDQAVTRPESALEMLGEAG